MAATVAVPVHAPEPIQVPALAWVASAIGVVVLYVMLQENGALLQQSWTYVHEFFHDGRHALGVPCH